MGEWEKAGKNGELLTENKTEEKVKEWEKHMDCHDPDNELSLNKMVFLLNGLHRLLKGLGISR